MTTSVHLHLLALTPDDLATLTNRGAVKRAQREIEEGQPTCTIEDIAGDLTFHWSDGIECRFPSGKTVHDAVCSSGSVGISRHVIRSVLAYQREHSCSTVPASSNRDRRHADQSESAAESNTISASISMWNPGEITDEALLKQFRKPAIAQARLRYEQGLLVELTRGAKPVARFLDEGLTVRFLVPGDLRYVSADCAEPMLPIWVVLAVWAFRELPPDRIGGLLSIHESELSIPKKGLETLHELLRELYRDGLSVVSHSWSARLSRLEPQLRDDGLIWPAELVLELLHQHEMYSQHDARFEPHQLARIVGELEVRRRTILSGTHAVPQLLVRGSQSDRTTGIAGGRLIGVGMGIVPGTRQTKIRAYLQDADSGSLMAVERSFANSDSKTGEISKSFLELADTVLVRGVSLRGLASSQLLLKSGKRTPAGELILPRTASSMTLHPQAYQWEALKPPFAVENIAQLRSRFESLPPDCLRPRRCTENLHVLPVQSVEEVRFDRSQQCLLATLVDAKGEGISLRHRYHFRGRQGFNDLYQILEQRKCQARFISGHLRAEGAGLVIEPIAFVIDDGSRRIGILPWLPAGESSEQQVTETVSSDFQSPHRPLPELFARLEHELSELLLTGVMQGNGMAWNELARHTSELGFVRFTEPIQALHAAFANRPNTIQWDAKSACAFVEELCLRICLVSNSLARAVK
ncbi:hypothetical protein [Planctomicrobium piriforme]|uniref:Uncharacterized protein n=1 Tax=Planctomicrobium piriforme TaxID=1576369 RepID=A0A1I3E113_9PLAN|nr:hypothetical protein [Planctomicrobium piriforme]SFH92528.1 hypothetical protein SAMN05421753_10431 [Planctomicrobium piriforme]